VVVVVGALTTVLQLAPGQARAMGLLLPEEGGMAHNTSHYIDIAIRLANGESWG